MRVVALGCAVAIVAAAIHFAAAKEPPDYEIRVPEALELEPGATGSVSLTIAPAEGFSISQDAPLVVRLSVEPTDGLMLPRTRYTREDAADERADAPRFDLAVEGKTAGDYTLSLAIRFWVCRKKTCRPVDENRKVVVKVAAPPPPPPDAGPIDAAPDAG